MPASGRRDRPAQVVQVSRQPEGLSTTLMPRAVRAVMAACMGSGPGGPGVPAMCMRLRGTAKSVIIPPSLYFNTNPTPIRRALCNLSVLDGRHPGDDVTHGAANPGEKVVVRPYRFSRRPSKSLRMNPSPIPSPPSPAMAEPLIGIRELADWLSVSEHAVRKWTASGPASGLAPRMLRVNGQIRFRACCGSTDRSASGRRTSGNGSKRRRSSEQHVGCLSRHDQSRRSPPLPRMAPRGSPYRQSDGWCGGAWTAS